jgi:dihydrofolate reductase
MVIAGRKTVADFPGGKPLPGRINVVLTRGTEEIPGFTVCHSPEEALQLAKTAERATVIGGGSVYRQMLPMCSKAYVTKVHCTPVSDTYFPNLDEDPTWFLRDTVMAGEENGIRYEMCVYERR